MQEQSLQELVADLVRALDQERARIDQLTEWSEGFEGELRAQIDGMGARLDTLGRNWQDTDQALRNHEYDRRVHPNA